MIVMKFGGSSLASAASIRRVTSIVRSQMQRNAVVVVSAMGDTTDHLLQILEHAKRAESYFAWKLQEEVKLYHFCVAEDLLSSERLTPVDEYIRQTFRDLHIRILEVCDGERAATGELRDWVASLGEQLASRIVAAALNENGVDARQWDSTKLIFTDDEFTHATPRYWETYARIRWSLPRAGNQVIVLGGFIGATEDGRTTTLGRGGSDLTASIVGAALNAEEIQVWKDVDGLLTWDPRVKAGGCRLRSLSYEEADELARAGATILHPETIVPARRLRIPVVIRNTFRPEGEGTTIGAAQAGSFKTVKSIACKTNVTVIELRSPTGQGQPAEYASAIERFCKEKKAATLLAVSDDAIYLAIEAGDRMPEFAFTMDQCMAVRLRSSQAILTLVGHELKRSAVAGQLSGLMAKKPAIILPQNDSSCSVQIVVPQEDFASWTNLLDDVYFKHLDPQIFASADNAIQHLRVEVDQASRVRRERPVLEFDRRRLIPDRVRP